MSTELFYVVVKPTFASAVKSVVLFNRLVNFNTFVKAAAKPPLSLATVSGGVCVISLAESKVTCYRAAGAVLQPDKDDAATVERFLFYGG